MPIQLLQDVSDDTLLARVSLDLGPAFKAEGDTMRRRDLISKLRDESSKLGGNALASIMRYTADYMEIYSSSLDQVSATKYLDGQTSLHFHYAYFQDQQGLSCKTKRGCTFSV